MTRFSKFFRNGGLIELIHEKLVQIKHLVWFSETKPKKLALNEPVVSRILVYLLLPI